MSQGFATTNHPGFAIPFFSFQCLNFFLCQIILSGMNSRGIGVGGPLFSPSQNLWVSGETRLKCLEPVSRVPVSRVSELRHSLKFSSVALAWMGLSKG